MGQVRLVTSLVLVVLFVLVIINVASVWADTFNPNPPVAGQAFTISGVQTAPIGAWQVSSACGAGTLYQVGLDTGAAPFTFTDSISALPAGTYYFSHQFDSTDCSSTGGFTVINPPPLPEYPLGLPLLAVLMILAYGVIRRRKATDIN